MNAIVVNYLSTDNHFALAANTRVELFFRAALAGTGKEVAVGIRLVRKKLESEIIWFEPRISALEICTNYKRKTKAKSGVNSQAWALNFVELLVNPEIEASSKASQSLSLERLSAEHFSSEKIVVNFEPYSLDDDAKVDIFLNYRRNLLATSVKMEDLSLFVRDECFCLDKKADRHCLLCR